MHVTVSTGMVWTGKAGKAGTDMRGERTVLGNNGEQHGIAYTERDRMPAALLIRCAAPAAAACLLALALFVVIAACAAPRKF